MSFANKVAIVTGASKGIGHAVARHFAREGAALAICARNGAEVAAAASELQALGAKVFHRQCDVANKTELRAFIEDSRAHLGSLDILVNNAAFMMRPQPFDGFDDDAYEQCIATSLNSVFYAMKAAVPFMKERGGKIVNFASMAGIRGTAQLAGYAAAKMGVIGLTKVAAMEWAKHRINVNCVAPIAMSDAWLHVMAAQPTGTDPFLALGLRRNVLGYAGDPEADIAPAVAFLCSDAARYITGHILPADGGLLDMES